MTQRPLPPHVCALVDGLLDEVRLNAPEDHERTAEQREQAAIGAAERQLAQLRRSLALGTCMCRGDEPRPCGDPECLVQFVGDVTSERELDDLHGFLDRVLEHAGVGGLPPWRR